MHIIVFVFVPCAPYHSQYHEHSASRTIGLSCGGLTWNRRGRYLSLGQSIRSFIGSACQDVFTIACSKDTMMAYIEGCGQSHIIKLRVKAQNAPQSNSRIVCPMSSISFTVWYVPWASHPLSYDAHHVHRATTVLCIIHHKYVPCSVSCIAAYASRIIAFIMFVSSVLPHALCAAYRIVTRRVKGTDCTGADTVLYIMHSAICHILYHFS